jgi:uncharacterized protein YjiS (DUF1127 family)
MNRRCVESSCYQLRCFGLGRARDLFHEVCVIEESNAVTCTCIENVASFAHKAPAQCTSAAIPMTSLNAYCAALIARMIPARAPFAAEGARKFGNIRTATQTLQQAARVITAHRHVAGEQRSEYQKNSDQESQISMDGSARAASGAPPMRQMLAQQSWVSELMYVLKCWQSAYRSWRLEQVAINQLTSLSDRQLKDIGLHRSEIVRALRDRAPFEPGFFPSERGGIRTVERVTDGDPPRD